MRKILFSKSLGVLLLSVPVLFVTTPNEKVKAQDNTWQLVWQDEFNGRNLDLSKWSYQEGTGTDVGLTDWGNKNYTSGRINTKGKFGTTFGKIEAAITLPKGQGLWPAFWMLPTDNKYGAWASSGELDIMEARGRELNKVDGTIHYGETWPGNRYSGGHYTFPTGKDITGKHIYAVEWENNEIRWYVDGNLYYKTS